jgi:hypothetical protein
MLLLIDKIKYILSARRFRKKSGNLLFDDSYFYRLNIGCWEKGTYGYVNIDERVSNKKIFRFSESNMPFRDSSVKYIMADSNYLADKEKNSKDILKEWSRIMVPCGIVALDNSNNLTDGLIKAFADNGFSGIFAHAVSRLDIKYFIHKNKKPGRAISDIKLTAADAGSIKLKYFLEYLEPGRIEEALLYIRGLIKEGENFFIEIPNERIETKEGDSINFFDKCNLSLLVVNSGFYIERIEINKENNILLKAGVRKDAPEIMIKSGEPAGKRICALCQYFALRFNHLGFHWEGVPHAFTRIGMESLLIESMRNWDTNRIKKAVTDFKPDYLLFSLKENFSLVRDLKPVLKKMNCKVLFWYCDPDHPRNLDMGDIIDVMFLSNRGQIEEYKKAYNLDRVYYMPQGYSPYSMHRVACNEVYDVGFAGAISLAALHETRKKVLNGLKKIRTIKVRRNVRNNISEFYSQSKLVLGGSDFDHELYTSNRFFVALGCGACYVTKKFKGIELLAENRKHLLWFETKEELFEIIDYYLSHDSEREKIRQAAEKLAMEKHTYESRIRDILDITEGRVPGFRGFL